MTDQFDPAARGPRRMESGTIRIATSASAERRTESNTAGRPSRYGELLAHSASMRDLFGRLQRLEGSSVSVLIAGESGTGKELVAQALHARSPVKSGPFVALNCGALDRQLARSELFGHVRGAFTGAVTACVGAFEAAHGGTLFLDEVGELPSDVQPVLLRALELRRVVPLGSHEERSVDVRLIAATHRDIAAEVRAGNFRSDLYYRIHVVQLDLPPLRNRPEDVAVLADEFARRLGASALPHDILEAFVQHDWPGNVRELRNAVEAYVALGSLPQRRAMHATPDDLVLGRFVDPSRAYAEQKDELVRRFTRVYLERLLRRTDNNQSEASRISGLERSYLGKLLDRLGLRTP